MLTDVITYIQPPAVTVPPTDMIDDKLPQQPPSYSDVPVLETADVPPTATPAKISDAEWQAKLKKLQKKIRKYNWTRRGDETAIVAAMRDLAASHTDAEVRAYWTRRAAEFEAAPDADKRSAVLGDVGRGLAVLIAAPFAIAGGILLAAGMLVKAGGDLLTGGKASAMSMTK